MFVDLKPLVDSVDDQLNTSSCTANAVTSALEILLHKQGKYRPLSRLFNYYCSRERRGELAKDAGTSLALAVGMVQEYGVPDESLFPFTIGNVFAKPDDSVFAEASKHVSTYTAELEATVDNVKAALNEGLPVIMAINITDKFAALNEIKDWRQMNWDGSGEVFGAHAMVIIGYDDACGNWLVEGSGGSQVADGGFYGFKYSIPLQGAYVIRGFDGFEVVKPKPVPVVKKKATPIKPKPKATPCTGVRKWLKLCK